MPFFTKLEKYVQFYSPDAVSDTNCSIILITRSTQLMHYIHTSESLLVSRNKLPSGKRSISLQDKNPFFVIMR